MIADPQALIQTEKLEELKSFLAGGNDLFPRQTDALARKASKNPNWLPLLESAVARPMKGADQFPTGAVTVAIFAIETSREKSDPRWATIAKALVPQCNQIILEREINRRPSAAATAEQLKTIRLTPTTPSPTKSPEPVKTPAAPPIEEADPAKKFTFQDEINKAIDNQPQDENVRIRISSATKTTIIEADNVRNAVTYYLYENPHTGPITGELTDKNPDVFAEDTQEALETIERAELNSSRTYDLASLISFTTPAGKPKFKGFSTTMRLAIDSTEIPIKSPALALDIQTGRVLAIGENDTLLQYTKPTLRGMFQNRDLNPDRVRVMLFDKTSAADINLATYAPNHARRRFDSILEQNPKPDLAILRTRFPNVDFLEPLPNDPVNRIAINIPEADPVYMTWSKTSLELIECVEKAQCPSRARSKTNAPQDEKGKEQPEPSLIR